jgi:hypothetical protein
MRDEATRIEVTLNTPERKKFSLPAENIIQTGLNAFGVPFLVYSHEYSNTVHSHFIIETPGEIQEKIDRMLNRHQLFEA